MTPQEQTDGGRGAGNRPGHRYLEAIEELESPWTKHFDDPRLEWRRIFAEVLGTFFLVLVSAGAVVIDALSNGAIGRVAAVVAPGLMVTAVILFLGSVSGAHLNPGVSIAFAARGYFPWKRVPGYILAQLAGATLACLFLSTLFGNAGMLGATEPGPGISDVQAMFMELVLTVGLVSVILGTSTRAQNLGPLSAFGVGGYIALAGLWSSPISGASMNSARSFGPDMVLLDFSHYWVYVIGPLSGALIAVLIAYILGGRAGGKSAMEAAQGMLGMRSDAKKHEPGKESDEASIHSVRSLQHKPNYYPQSNMEQNPGESAQGNPVGSLRLGA